jgi:hypothetical protein
MGLNLSAGSMALILLLAAQASQPPTRIINPTNNNPNPGDTRLYQFEDPKGENWRVFAVNSYPEGPVIINQVEEVRQQNPPSTWGVYIGNRELFPVASLTMAAAVVDVNGKIRATQPLPAIKNLKPQQVVRKEVRIRVTVLTPTDRVVFFLKDMISESGDWKAVDSEVADLVKIAAQRLPVP